MVNDAGKPNRSPTATAVLSNPLWKRIEEDINQWLDPPNQSTNYTMARQARHKGTAEWFLHGSNFKQWKSEGRLFWIHGMRVFVFLS
jgi:hypothetical protein